MSAYSIRSNTRAARHAKHARHVGFLNYSRRTLGFGAILACASLTALQALPAEADPLPVEIVNTDVQSFAAPQVVTAAPVVRDAFEISAYSVVQWPVPSGTTMASGYGYRNSCGGCSRFHQGIDLNPGAGFPISAISDGVVSQVGNPSGSLGVFVKIDHVIDGQHVTSTYGHMQMGSLSLQVGDTVSAGQQVGRVGNTGTSTGAHLHFAIEIGSELIDPLPWLRANVNS